MNPGHDNVLNQKWERSRGKRGNSQILTPRLKKMMRSDGGAIAEAVCRATIRAAMQGNPAVLKMLYDRLDGPVTVDGASNVVLGLPDASRISILTQIIAQLDDPGRNGMDGKAEPERICHTMLGAQSELVPQETSEAPDRQR